MKTIRRIRNGSLIRLPFQIMIFFLLAGCTKSSSSYYSSPSPSPNPNPGKGGNSVSIYGMAFNPSSLTVAVNTAVTWTNGDAVAHTVTSDTPLFDSGPISASGGYGGGGSYTYTFTVAGTYNYHCSIHPMMTGKIIVQ
jgi:plastocyanin